MVLRPVGDLPPSVYWVRRLVVLAVLALVVVLLWWLWPGGDETTPTGSQQPSATPTPSVTPTPSSSPTKSKGKQTASPSDEPVCADEDIAVTVKTDASRYPVDVDPAITFTVANDSGKTCVRDVGAAANELRITSGGATVWSSDYCNPGGDEDLKTLGPGDNYVETYTWGRVLSSKGCPTPLEPAEPGTYEVLALNGDVTSEPAQFVLE